jgi:hypothetical protein
MDSSAYLATVDLEIVKEYGAAADSEIINETDFTANA